MNCSETRNLPHAYLDHELDITSATAAEQHLHSCTACRKIFAQQSALRSAVRRQAVYYTAPSALADRIRARIDGTTVIAPARTSMPGWQWLRLGAAVAVTAVVTWIAALELNYPSPDEAIAEQVLTGHARSVLTTHLANVASSDQHTVKPWLSSKLDFSPPVTDLTTAGFPLVGGRLDYVDNRSVAVLVYRHRQHVINLFIWPDSNAGKASPLQPVSKRGYNLLHWSAAGMNYWAISDLNPAEMKTFAETYAGAQ